METQIKKRIDWIDIAKGIGIISMVVGHNIVQLQPIIYSFHMPLFFILSGFTIKDDWNKFKEYTVKDIKRLIIPLFITQILISLCGILIKNNNYFDEIRRFFLCLIWGNHFKYDSITIGRVWFLVALFWSKFCYRIFIHFFEENQRIPILMIGALGGIFLGKKGIILPQNFDMIFICMFFIEIGVELKKINFTKVNSRIYIICVTIWIYLAQCKNIWISMNMREYPLYAVCLVEAVIGCLCVFIFCMSIEKLYLSKVFVFFGKNSLVLLCIQSIAPHIFVGQNIYQKVFDIIIECILVVVYTFLKKNILKYFNKA